MKEIKRKIKENKLYLYIGISILVLLLLLGGTYAYYNYVATRIDVSTITRGLDYYINYTKGNDITSSTLNPSISYTGGNNLTLTLYKKDNTYNIYGHIYLDVSSISTSLSTSGALKYVVISEDTIISSGSLGNIAANKSYLLTANISLEIVETTYTVYLWYDSTEENAELGENSSISATVRCEATMEELNVSNYNSASLANNIIELYNSATKTAVVNNSVTYQYDTTNKLMKDVGNNIRYYGASPNNYIYFNCSDYSNQSDNTCEKWRIIGVFNGKVKLIRNSVIGNLAYDQDKNFDNTLTSFDNNWVTSSLNWLLNEKYYNGNTTGTITYYSGQSGGTSTSLNMASIGIKNAVTRNLITNENYSLLSWNSSSIYSNQMYNYERTTGTVYTGNPTSWTGKIAIPYLSDYGYAADFNSCSQNFYSYDNSLCTSNNWIKPIFSADYNWLLASNVGGGTGVWRANSSGYVHSSYYTHGAFGVVPVLHINSSLEIKEGNGSSTNPYRLNV